MSDQKDVIKDSVMQFHQFHSVPEPIQEKFKRTMTFYFDFHSHSYLKAIAKAYNVPVTTIGTHFFESIIPSIVNDFPDGFREEVIEYSLEFQREFLKKQGYTEEQQESLLVYYGVK